MKLLNIVFCSSLLILTCCGTKKTKANDITSSEDLSKPVAINSLNFTKAYNLVNKEFGTSTSVIIKGGKRIMKTNALPNHKTGEFPNPGNPNKISAQNREHIFPMTPKFSGRSRWAREPGIAVNGVKFEPETAERFVCETGEVYRIEAFQELVDLGLDFNNAHVQPTGEYHYHGAPKELIKTLDNGEDIILIGFAKDGFPIYYSKSGKYKPSFKLNTEVRTGDVCSYKNPHTSMNKELKNTNPDGTFESDWKYTEGLGDLDECNGITRNGKYMYFATDEYPYIGRCLKGEFTEKGPKGPPPPGAGMNGGQRQGGHHHKPGEEHDHDH